MSRPLRILLVEDAQDEAMLVLRQLHQSGYVPKYECVKTESAMREALQRATWDAVIAEFTLPCFSGLDALRVLQETGHDIPFLIVSDVHGEENAVAAIKAGADDYVMKDRLSQLPTSVERALCEVQARRAASVREENHELDTHREQPVRSCLSALRTEIARREHIEAALRDSEQRVRTIFEQTAFGVSLIETATGRFVRINQKYCDIVGYTVEEMKRLTFQTITHPDDLQADLDNMQRLIAGEIREFTMEKRYCRKDESVVWVNLNVTPTWQPGEKPVHHIAVVKDFTERKRLEEERQKFVSLADSSPEFIGMCDRDFRPFYVNAAGLSLVGLDSLADALQVTVQDCFFPEDRPFVMNEFFPCVLNNGHGEIEIRFRHFKTGEAIWMLYNVFNIFDAGGAVVGWATVSRNIHERKRAEQALRESEERLRLAQQVAHIGSFEWNIQTGVNLWTQELEAIYGLQPGEFGKTQPAWQNLVHPDDRDAAVGCVQQALTTGEPIDGEWRIVRPDGSVHWIAGRFQAFKDAAGKLLRLAGINIDVTERKQTEARLTTTLNQLQQLTAHLESVREEERTRIAREIHDELGQALTVLKLELSWIKNQLAREQMDDRRVILVAKAEGMSALIDTTIQSMRRIVTELRPGILDRFGLAAALEWQGQEFFNRTGIRCTVAVGEHGLDQNSSTALFRIVQEALTNVARHSGATAVEVRSSEETKTLLFVIEDNGSGISEHVHTSLQSFGLIGMRERATAAGGQLQIVSAPGRGTRINVQVPLPVRHSSKTSEI